VNREAYDTGYDAYWEGAEDAENPYDAELEADVFKSWEEGWRKAREHDYDESEG